MASTGDAYSIDGSFLGIDVKEFNELKAEVERLRVPKFFWDDRDLERSVETIGEGVAFDDPGDIIELRPIHELPTIYVLVTEDGHAVFDSREEAEKAANTTMGNGMSNG